MNLAMPFLSNDFKRLHCDAAVFDSFRGFNLITNLICATCAQADALVGRGYRLEAKRLLAEAAMLEPAASIVLERLGEVS